MNWSLLQFRKRVQRAFGLKYINIYYSIACALLIFSWGQAQVQAQARTLAGQAPRTQESRPEALKPASGPASRAKGGLGEKLQKAADDASAALGGVGIQIAVCRDDGREWSVVAGFNDEKLHSRLESSARIPAGSTGKTFFSALAMQLIAEGKFSLDDKISKHLGSEPWFGRLPNASDITVRMLMNHTSGLVRYELNPEFLRDLRADPFREWTTADRVKYLFDAKAPFRAGESWDYSDTNYIVLAHLIERVAGVNCYQEIRKRFLEPFQLAGTLPADRPDLPGLAQGTTDDPNEFGNSTRMVHDGKMILNPQFEGAGGGFVTNATDLARWARRLYGGNIIPESLQKEFYKWTPAKMLGPRAAYGLGVIHWESPVGELVGHSGYFPGYLTEVRWLPAQKIAFAVQWNSTKRPVLLSAQKLLQSVLAMVAAEGAASAGGADSGR